MRRSHNYGAVVLALVLSALLVKIAPWSHPEEVTKSPAEVTKTKDRRKRTLPPPFRPAELHGAHPTQIKINQEELGLSFDISHQNGDVSIKLVNHAEHPFHFHNNMELDSGSFPSATRIEVRDAQGRPFIFKIGDHISHDHWTPLYLTSRAFLNSELKTQTLEPGLGFCRTIPLEHFFGGANFDFRAQDYQARVRSKIYLDDKFQQYIEAETDWFDLPQDIGDIPTPLEC